jgi:hypothetical protein
LRFSPGPMVTMTPIMLLLPDPGYGSQSPVLRLWRPANKCFGASLRGNVVGAALLNEHRLE